MEQNGTSESVFSVSLLLLTIPNKTCLSTVKEDHFLNPCSHKDDSTGGNCLSLSL
jgi:hypothetical protein